MTTSDKQPQVLSWIRILWWALGLLLVLWLWETRWVPRVRAVAGASCSYRRR